MSENTPLNFSSDIDSDLLKLNTSYSLESNHVDDSMYLVPQNEMFKKALNMAISLGIADLVIQEAIGVSIITSTKETKTLIKLNNEIIDKHSFVKSCLNDLWVALGKEEFWNKFILDDIKEENLGINYKFTWQYKGTEYTNKIIRLRCTCIKELRWLQINIRIGNVAIPSYKDLDLEKFRELFEYSSWLILVSWPTWSWKTTIINSILQDVLSTKNKHILTLEDPVEFVYNDEDIKWLITYRELWTNFTSYYEWIKNSLRLSPNIIMLWEIRDSETANAALEAVLSWHLVISTMHTDSAVWAIQKFQKWAQNSSNPENIDIFADFLKGILIQKLIKTVDKEWKPVVIPIREILYGEPKIAANIKKGWSANHENGKTGGQTWLQSIKQTMDLTWSESATMNKYILDLFAKWKLTDPLLWIKHTNDIPSLKAKVWEDKIRFQDMFGNNFAAFKTELDKYDFS